MMQSVKDGVESGILYKRYGPDAVRSIDSVLQSASISDMLLQIIIHTKFDSFTP